MRRGGFTLLELLLANVLVAILIGGVLLMVSAMARESASMAVRGSADPSEAVIRAIRWDLMNTESARMLPKGRGFVLVGHGGIDQKSLMPNSRRTRVIYEVRRRGSAVCLVREQAYLDDAARLGKWEELVGSGIDWVSIAGGEMSREVDEQEIEMDESAGFVIPASVRIQIGMGDRVVEREVWLR